MHIDNIGGDSLDNPRITKGLPLPPHAATQPTLIIQHEDSETSKP